ncbi:hypothetical protein AgCh_024394 [Apium graveolens]
MSSVKASRNAPTSFNDLPHEMTANILLRLPVKALIRSTSVNKKWLAGNDYRVVRVVYVSDSKGDQFGDMAPKVEEDGRCYRSGHVWMLSFDFDNEVFRELKVPRIVSKCLEATAVFELMEFEATLKKGGWPHDITNRGTILIQKLALLGLVHIRGILSCNLKTMHYKNLGICMQGATDEPLLRPKSCIIETSFRESLGMYEEGKSLVKFAK